MLIRVELFDRYMPMARLFFLSVCIVMWGGGYIIEGIYLLKRELRELSY